MRRFPAGKSTAELTKTMWSYPYSVVPVCPAIGTATLGHPLKSKGILYTLPTPNICIGHETYRVSDETHQEEALTITKCGPRRTCRRRPTHHSEKQTDVLLQSVVGQAAGWCSPTPTWWRKASWRRRWRSRYPRWRRECNRRKSAAGKDGSRSEKTRSGRFPGVSPVGCTRRSGG